MIYSFENRPESIATSHPRCRNIEYPTMIHKQIELIYLLAGSASCTIDGVESTLNVGDMAVIFPYIAHSYSFKDAEYIMLFFQPELCQDYEIIIKKYKPVIPIISGCDKNQFGSLILKAFEGHDSKTEFGLLLSKSYLNVIMGEFFNTVEVKENTPTDHNIVNAILSYCSKNYMSPGISIQSLSKAIGISPKYCSYLINSLMNTNFRQYINSLRSFEAARLIANTDMPITRIAFDVGYENQSTFNRAFLTQYGMTPKEYRLSKRQKK